MTDAIKRHYQWRKRVNRYAPQIMAQIFALRGKMYRGAGFHWSLEKRAGAMLARLNDYDNPLELYHTVIDKIGAHAILRDLKDAEASAREWELSSGPPVSQCPFGTAPPAS